MDGLFKVALAGCYDAEGDAWLRLVAWGAFGSVEVGAGLDDLVGEGLGHAVLGEMPVAVHRVEVELRRVHDEVVIQVFRVRHGLQQSAALVERDFGLPAVPDPCPCLGFLRRRAGWPRCDAERLRCQCGPPRRRRGSRRSSG